MGAGPHSQMLSFQPGGHQAAACRAGTPANPRIGEPLPVSASCACVGRGGGYTDGAPQVAAGGQQASVTRLPLPHPTLSPEPALGPIAVLGNGVKASG